MEFIQVFLLFGLRILLVLEVAALSEPAVSVGVVVPAFSHLQGRLVHRQFFDSMSEYAI